jgi:hypothetical protein
MRMPFTTVLAAATICLFTASGWAAPSTGALNQAAAPLIQLAQYGGYGGGYEHPHHYCHRYWHWACRYGECRCYRD